jgi:DNA-directed RNA polymerase specialized sigma24 family protein
MSAHPGDSRPDGRLHRWAEFVVVRRRWLRALVARDGRIPAADVEDAVQDIQIRALLHPPATDSGWPSYLYRCYSYEVVDIDRRKHGHMASGRAKGHTQSLDALREVGWDATAPGDPYAAIEAVEALQQGPERLSERDAAIVFLQAAGYSSRELARFFGMEVNAVDQVWSRGRRKWAA